MLLTSDILASNWFQLQGTENKKASKPYKAWGFIQVQHQDNQSQPNPGGGFVPSKLVGPDLESQSGFNVNRAKLGVRGIASSLSSDINYFVLAEFGNNGVTEKHDSMAKLTDASITFNQLDGVRLRLGLFKHPGAEEGLRAVGVSDYINFTWVTNQLLLERYPNALYTSNIAPQSIPPVTDLYGFNTSVGAFRDVGFQVFDWFDVGDNWELTYAVMLGQGSGLSFSDNDDNLDTYAYLSAEKIFAGKGPKRQGIKLFFWSQDGERTADLTDDLQHNPQEYNRKRNGLGVKYYREGLRILAEQIKGEGMIFLGPHNPSFGLGPAAGNPLSDSGHGAYGEGVGYYLDLGYRIPNTKWEIDVRYDHYTRLKDNQFEIKYRRTTLGVQYFFNPKLRLAVNFEYRDASASNFAPFGSGPSAGPNNNLAGIDNVVGIQLTSLFTL